MAKKSAAKADDKVAAFRGGIAERLRAQNDRMVEKMGTEIVPMDLVGLKLPHLALRYLFRRRVIPFCRNYIFYGPPCSAKSSLLYYFYKLFVDAGGYYFHLETEDKDQPDLRASVMGYPAHITDSDWAKRASSINVYQQLYYGYTKWMKDECARVGVGATVPLVIGIDTLTAKLADHTVTAYEKEGGQVTQRFGEAANSIANWLRVCTNYLHEWPFILIGVNHDKPKSDKYGNDKHHAPGGVSQIYMATTKVLCEQIGKLHRTAEGVEGVKIRMHVDKNSLAPTGQAIEVEYAWRVEAGKPQETWFDFDKASVVLVAAVMETAKGDLKEQLRELTGLSKKNENSYTCKALGITDPVHPSVIGRALEESPIMVAIDELLEVREGLVYEAGRDLSTYLRREASE